MPICIVGAGSIGSWTALALSKLGCSNITVADFDDVEEQNVGSQIYTSIDVGKKKLEALDGRLRLLVDNGINFLEGKVDGEHIIPPGFEIVVSAVDNMEARRDIFMQLLPGRTKTIYLDGRMAANNIQIFAIPMDNKDRADFYKTTLFDSSEADPIACSARSVVYNCFVISGLLTDMIAKIANGKMPPKELIVDLENLTMFGGMDS